MTAPDIAGIAAGLTKDEADWLLRPQDRLHADDTFAALTLEDKRLAKPMYCPTAEDFGHIATRKGLAVRTHLLQETDA